MKEEETVEPVEAAIAAPPEPLWKRGLFFDLGVPGQILEWLIKGLFIIAMGNELLIGFTRPDPPVVIIKPMEGLVLSTGSPWQLENEKLSIGALHSAKPAVMTLPFECREWSYTLRFSMTPANADSDVELVFPVGQAQAVLMLNLQRFTGLELLGGRRWSFSGKKPVKYHVAGENEVSVDVSLREEDATVSVAINGEQRGWWSGNPSELAMDRLQSKWKVQGNDMFGIATSSGGVAVSAMRMKSP